MNLHETGLIFNTDKTNNHHTFKNRSYLDIYEQYFNKFKNENINILEIGVKGGHSLRLWKNWFPNAKIVGLDLNPDCLKHTEERIEIFIGSQDDSLLINKIINKYKNFSIIIDDGSHINDLIVRSYHLLFQHLLSNGLYIIEDLNCSYEDLNTVGGWEGELDRNKALGVNLSHKRQTMDLFFKKIINDIDFNIINQNKNTPSLVESIHFYSQLAIIGRV